MSSRSNRGFFFNTAPPSEIAESKKPRVATYRKSEYPFEHVWHVWFTLFSTLEIIADVQVMY